MASGLNEWAAQKDATALPIEHLTAAYDSTLRTVHATAASRGSRLHACELPMTHISRDLSSGNPTPKVPARFVRAP